MTIEQKLFLKLEPHAKRIKDGEGNDFDYLPAVLLNLMEVQDRQAKLLDEATKQSDSTVSTAFDKTQSQIQNSQSLINKLISDFASADAVQVTQTHERLDAIQSQIQNSQSLISNLIADFASAHAVQVTQTHERLDAIQSQIKSLADEAQRSNTRVSRFLMAALLGIVVTIGLTTAILLRR